VPQIRWMWVAMENFGSVKPTSLVICRIDALKLCFQSEQHYLFGEIYQNINKKLKIERHSLEMHVICWKTQWFMHVKGEIAIAAIPNRRSLKWGGNWLKADT
jgi:hypothetical protein